MKYISLLFFVFFLSIPASYSAGDCEGTCKIVNTPDFIINTISELRKISKNIETETSKIKTSDTSINKINASMLKAYNSITNWGWYFSSFEYAVIFPIKNSVPAEVKRDQRLIEKEADYLKKILDKIYKKWINDEKIENICNWITTTYIKCSEKSGTASQLIEELIQDIYMMNDFYKKSIVWADTNESSTANYLNSAFFTEMKKYYNANTAEDCSKCEWGFSEKVSTAVDKISEIQKGTGRGIQEWVDAWNMLIWDTDKNQREKREAELLKAQLAKEWISWSAADNVIKDLENFNATDSNWEKNFFSTNNNFFTNSFKRLSENVMPQINNFESSVSQVFRNQINKSKNKAAWEQWTIVITDVQETETESTITKDLIVDFETMYKTEQNFIGLWDEKNKDLEWKIVELHDKLSLTIKSFVDICPLTQKICNAQIYGQWNCECKK